MRFRPSVHDALFICVFVSSMQHVRAEPERFAEEHQKCTVGRVVERPDPGPVLEQLAEERPIRSASDHAPRPPVVQRGQPELQRLEIVSQVRVLYHTLKYITVGPFTCLLFYFKNTIFYIWMRILVYGYNI